MTKARFIFGTVHGLTVLLLVAIAVGILAVTVSTTWVPFAVVAVATLGGVALNFLYNTRYGDPGNGREE
ncbi:hypothetical protein C1I95_27810 [Micromonospora craterilacus]|uniref:Uncharacterized protein n=1 Tax=Micromonospora craterilacus TaxID=1655439 RepID=A0A2W2EFF5_9ACTN|nr:hypothetical protein [Micromonospora craterilacus]PZG10768.1 hypothetical protein C1I95_27810 [Micromonospora craterilacus]